MTKVTSLDPGGPRDVGSGPYRWLSSNLSVTLLPGDRLGITGCACVGPGRQTLGVFCDEGIACPCGELVAVPLRWAPDPRSGVRWLGTDRELARAMGINEPKGESGALVEGGAIARAAREAYQGPRASHALDNVRPYPGVAAPPRPHAGPGWCACGLPDPSPHAEGDGPYFCVCGGLLRPAHCRCHASHDEPCRRPRAAPLGALRKGAP